MSLIPNLKHVQIVKNRTKNLRPDILTQAHIPKDLIGINPRTIMGNIKWKKLSKKIRRDNGNFCLACGVHASNAEGRRFLESHESFTINYKKVREKFLCPKARTADTKEEVIALFA